MFDLLVIKVKVKTSADLPDEMGAILNKRLQDMMEKALNQIVFDLGENGSGIPLKLEIEK